MQLLSPYAFLQGHASRQPNAEAIVIDDVTITYAEFLERVSSFSGWLLQNGFNPYEVTGICIRDEIGHLTTALATLCLGAPQIGLGSHETAETRRALSRKVGVTQLIIEKPEDWMEGLRLIVPPLRDPRVMRGASTLRASEGFPGRAPDATAIYHNTSGSTSIPKTIGHTFDRLLRLGKPYYADPKQRRVLRIGSIELEVHRVYRIYSLLAGNSCIFLRQPSLERLLDICERAEVSAFQVGARRLLSLVRAEASPHRKIPSFTSVHTGGSRVPGHLREELKRALTDNLWVLYSTSEVGTISCASPDQHHEFPEGVGFPAEGVTVEIVDANGEPQTPGEIGEIRVRKPGFFQGYVGDAEGTSNFVDGWFYPRDLVSMKEGEPLIFHGRADDVMILNGINIYPSAIEDLLESHPGVVEAAAYPITSHIHGEIPVAAVVLKEEARCDVSELLDRCRAVLGIRAPRQIFMVDALPRNAGGKILRRVLAAWH